MDIWVHSTLLKGKSIFYLMVLNQPLKYICVCVCVWINATMDWYIHTVSIDNIFHTEAAFHSDNTKSELPNSDINDSIYIFFSNNINGLKPLSNSLLLSFTSPIMQNPIQNLCVSVMFFSKLTIWSNLLE